MPDFETRKNPGEGWQNLQIPSSKRPEELDSYREMSGVILRRSKPFTIPNASETPSPAKPIV